MSATLTLSTTQLLIGNALRVSVAFKDDNTAAPIDPTTVIFESKSGTTGTKTPLTYSPNSGPIVRDGTGLYHYQFDPNEIGEWHVGFYSTGGTDSAAEGIFVVAASRVT